MSELTALRLYFPLSAKAGAGRFWQRLTAPMLGQHLLGCARRAGIQQVILYPVRAGYLPGEKFAQHVSEAQPGHLPQCIELIDSETRLRRFLREHAQELQKVRAVLFRCELPVQTRAGAAGP